MLIKTNGPKSKLKFHEFKQTTKQRQDTAFNFCRAF